MRKISRFFTPARQAITLLAAAWAGVTSGIAMVSVPAALIVGSILLGVYGLFFIDVDRPVRRRRP